MKIEIKNICRIIFKIIYVLTTIVLISYFIMYFPIRGKIIEHYREAYESSNTAEERLNDIHEKWPPYANMVDDEMNSISYKVLLITLILRICYRVITKKKFRERSLVYKVDRILVAIPFTLLLLVSLSTTRIGIIQQLLQHVLP